MVQKPKSLPVTNHMIQNINLKMPFNGDKSVQLFVSCVWPQMLRNKLKTIKYNFMIRAMQKKKASKY